MTDLPRPPVAATRPHSFSAHGVTIDDPWAWLKDPGYPNVTDKDVLAYLEEENAWFEQVIAPLKPLSERLFKEMRGRIKEDDSQVPAPDGPWLYYDRYRKGGRRDGEWQLALEVQERG